MGQVLVKLKAFLWKTKLIYSQMVDNQHNHRKNFTLIQMVRMLHHLEMLNCKE